MSLTVGLFAILGLICGAVTVPWLNRLIAREREAIGWPAPTASDQRWRWRALPLSCALAFGMMAWVTLSTSGIQAPEVQPSPTGAWWRLSFHCLLLFWILLATLIDFDCYLIPDAVTVPGMLLGLLGALLTGDVQIAHLYVDWTAEVPGILGPTIPAWYSQHPHWHGLSWSLAGLMAGGGLTAAVRWAAEKVYGREALGFGDVTFMAMIGCYLGWQAIILAFFVAPLIGAVFAIPLRFLFNINHIPYGPSLGAGATLVLISWSFWWRQTRLLFSDPIALSWLAGIGIVAFIGLTGLIWLYRRIPLAPGSTNSSDPLRGRSEINGEKSK